MQAAGCRGALPQLLFQQMRRRKKGNELWLPFAISNRTGTVLSISKWGALCAREWTKPQSNHMASSRKTNCPQRWVIHTVRKHEYFVGQEKSGQLEL
ncbi:hypothetical protein ACRRTK_015524 [Alexandromys fortis]